MGYVKKNRSTRFSFAGGILSNCDIILVEGRDTMCSEETWRQIRTEYTTTDTTYRKLCEKYGVSFNTLKDRAVREKWRPDKLSFQKKVSQQTQHKAAKKIATKVCGALEKELRAAEMINNLIIKALEDPQQFNRHLVNIKKKRDYDEDQWVEEKIFDKMDTKSLKDLADTLNKSTELKKKILGMIDPVDREKLDMDRQKLEMEREVLAIAKMKAGIGDGEEDETGVAILPEVEYKILDAAIEEERRDVVIPGPEVPGEEADK
jgi:transposase-like protein